MTRHVVILAGGLSHEREVSLRSGSRLHEALKGSGVDVTMRDTDSELISWLAETKPDAASAAGACAISLVQPPPFFQRMRR